MLISVIPVAVIRRQDALDGIHGVVVNRSDIRIDMMCEHVFGCPLLGSVANQTHVEPVHEAVESRKVGEGVMRSTVSRTYDHQRFAHAPNDGTHSRHKRNWHHHAKRKVATDHKHQHIDNPPEYLVASSFGMLVVVALKILHRSSFESVVEIFFVEGKCIVIAVHVVRCRGACWFHLVFGEQLLGWQPSVVAFKQGGTISTAT
mmetsp:Transcript_62317/g.99100  ORF Transcript_62317/g.99100 Transcript_62317/m.99100 type:complete len:203 (-) Transcript_62317:173-781(-)